MTQKVVLLVNTGTPDNPDVTSVKRYLKEFLNDPMVIDIPWIFRMMLVNLIIVPFRASRSARLYKRLWTGDGSPLKINLEKLVCKLQLRLADRYRVIGAMRYGSPSIRSALQSINEETDLTVIPLYPQYARATTGSVKETILRESGSFRKIKSVRFTEQFYSHPSFVKVLSERISSLDLGKFDHIVFSYHSLPVSQIKKIHPSVKPQSLSPEESRNIKAGNSATKTPRHEVTPSCSYLVNLGALEPWWQKELYSSCECEKLMPVYGLCCYKAACYDTTRLIAGKLNLKEGSFTTTFQSRMSKRWIGPFTDQVLVDLAYSGKLRVLVVAPSFVSDCLETLIEIKEDYKKLFLSAGGENLDLMESLNYEDDWVEGLRDIIGNPEG
jgi:ferrochelatase